MNFSKGDRVRIKGLFGEAKIMDRWCNPGEKEAQVKVAFISRSGKVDFHHIRTFYEKDLLPIQ